MTSEHDKCGIQSLLPMSCRGKAEDFARRLHHRLRSLGSQDGSNGSTDENSWLAGGENPVAVSQPRHTSDSDLYFDFGLLESPGSPDEDAADTELTKLMSNNKDNLHLTHCADCHCPKINTTINLSTNICPNSQDSDSSDGAYYDPDSDIDQKFVQNNNTNGAQSIDSLSRDSGECSLTQQNGVETSESSPVLEEIFPVSTVTLSEETSTTSLKDDDLPSLEFASCTLDLTSDESINIPEVHTFSEGVQTEPITEIVPQVKMETLLTVDDAGQISEYTQTVDECEGEEDENDERIPRVRRCSSLKTGKTPPGTPGRKKIVRFADVLGLDLADVRTFLDEIPKIPNSAYNDLVDADLSASASDISLSSGLDSKYQINLVHRVEKVLVPLFQQPGGQADFIERVREGQVCLENAIVDDPIAMSIKGTVRVRNLDFNKSVHIRYTLDCWRSYADMQGQYVVNSCDGFSDTFSFLLYAHTLSVGQRLEFAVRFQCKGCQYWDNNRGANYCFQCLPASNNTPYMPITGMDDQLGAAFY